MSVPLLDHSLSPRIFLRCCSLALPLLIFSLLIFSFTSLNAQTFEFEEREKLLKRCWSEEQLKGKALEKNSRRSNHGVHPPRSLKPPLQQSNEGLKRYLDKGTVRWVKLPKGKKLIALTLDLCEAAYEISGYDGGVIDYLRLHKIKATLFVGGKWLDHHSERAQQLLLDPLFEIGSHGWSHKNLRRLSGKALVREITAVQGAYDRARSSLSKRFCVMPSLMANLTSALTPSTGSSALKFVPKRLNLFRFPFGTCHKKALREVYKHGQIPIQWNVVTGDPAFGQSARRIASIIKQRVKPGAIIIAHANGRGRNTAKALPLFIPELIKRGYQFVTVSELLKAGEPQFSSTCYENRPGDNNHY